MNTQIARLILNARRGKVKLVHIDWSCCIPSDIFIRNIHAQRVSSEWIFKSGPKLEIIPVSLLHLIHLLNDGNAKSKGQHWVEQNCEGIFPKKIFSFRIPQCWLYVDNLLLTFFKFHCIKDGSNMDGFLFLCNDLKKSLTVCLDHLKLFAHKLLKFCKCHFISASIILVKNILRFVPHQTDFPSHQFVCEPQIAFQLLLDIKLNKLVKTKTSFLSFVNLPE